MPGKAGAIRAGRAYVEAYLDSGQLDKDIAQTRAKLNNFANRVGTIGGVIAGLGTAIVAPLAKVTAETAQAGFELRRMAAQLGASVEGLSALQYAAGQSGVEIDDLKGAMEELNIRMGEAVQDGTGPLAESFKKLGLDAKELAKLKPEERFLKVAQAISQIQNEADRGFLADEIFGGDAFKILPLLLQGEAGIQSLMDKARELGVVMSEEDAAAADELSTSLNDLEQQTDALGRTVGVALLPMANDFAEWLQETVPKVRSWLKENEALVQNLAKLGIALVTVGSGLIAMAVAAKGVSIALGVVQSAAAMTTANLATLGTTAAAAFAIAAIVLFARHIYQTRDAVVELNKALERSNQLNEERARIQARQKQEVFDQANQLAGQNRADFLEEQLEMARKELQGKEASAKGQQKLIDGLRKKQQANAKAGLLFGGLGTMLIAGESGGNVLETERKALEGINDELEIQKKHVAELERLHKAAAQEAEKNQGRPAEKVQEIESVLKGLEKQFNEFGLTGLEKMQLQLIELGATAEEMTQFFDLKEGLEQMQADKKAHEENQRAKEMEAEKARQAEESINTMLQNLENEVSDLKLPENEREQARRVREFEQLGATPEQIAQLKRGLAQKAELLDEPESLKQSAQAQGGTFSSLASRIFASGSSDPMKQVADSTKETAQNTRKIARQGRAQFGP